MYIHSVYCNGEKIGEYRSDVQLGAGEPVKCADKWWKILGVRYELTKGRLEVEPWEGKVTMD